MVGRLIGLSVIISYKGGKLHVQALSLRAGWGEDDVRGCGEVRGEEDWDEKIELSESTL